MESTKTEESHGADVPASGDQAPHEADKALDNQRRHSESISPTSPLDNPIGESGHGESSRVKSSKKNSIQRPRHYRIETNSSIADPGKSPESRHRATSKSSVDSNSGWALVRYGEILEEDDVGPGSWDGTLVRRSGIDYFNAGLHLAAKRGEARLACYCLENGAEIESKTELGETALHLAVLHEHDHIVLLLLERGANVEAEMENGSKPLYIAATQGHIQISNFLVKSTR